MGMGAPSDLFKTTPEQPAGAQHPAAFARRGRAAAAAACRCARWDSPVSPDAAEALFRVVDAAYEKRSLAISSNIHPSRV
jgi:hypothetical protein